MGAWVPGRAVPWGLGRLPWAPGAPPRGSQGGGPGPKLQGPLPLTSRHFHLSTLWIRIKIDVDFDIDFWSFWDRSWAPLGGHFRSCWRLFRPKLVPEPSSNRLVFEKVIVHETLRFPMFLGPNGPQDGAKMDPRSLQDGSKIVLDRFFSSWFFASIFDRFWFRLGADLGSQMEPRGGG